jgi:hypothetical protein
MVLYIIIFKFLEKIQENKDHEHNGHKHSSNLMSS